MFTNEKIEGSKISEVPSSIDNNDDNEFKGFTYVTNSVSIELAEMKQTEEEDN